MEINALFPTPVGIFNLNRNFTPIEKKFFLNLEVKNNSLNKISKDRLVLNNEEMFNLKSFIDSCMEQYISVVFGRPKNFKLRITYSWCNYTNQNEGHHSHKHGHSIVSGVLYLQTNENDSIKFFKESQEHLYVESQEANEFSSTTWKFPATQGSLLLFPSYLKHSVDQKKDSNVRISLSFNTFPVGTVGIPGSLEEMVFL